MDQGRSPPPRPPESLAERRSSISRTIASLAPSASVDEAEKVLRPMIDNILLSWEECGTNHSGPRGANEDLGENVTALMVCCDKSQLGALTYIEQRLDAGSSAATASIAILVGHPMEQSSEQCGGNLASHHAASSQFAPGIDVLVAMLRRLHVVADESLDNDTKGQANQTSAGLPFHQAVADGLSYRGYYLLLLSQRNSHGDTPIMMGCASANESMLQHWIHQLLRTNGESHEESIHSSSQSCDPTLSDIRRTFQMKNDAGDTALSIAYGHGFYSVVDVLISPLRASDSNVMKMQMENNDEGSGGLVAVSYDDVEKCRAVLARIDSVRAVMQKRGGQQLQDFESRRKNVRRCFDALQAAYEVLAQRSMAELLVGESAKDNQRQENKHVTKSSGNVKKKQTGRNSKRQPERGNAVKEDTLSSSEVLLQASSDIVECQKSQGDIEQESSSKGNAWKLSKSQLSSNIDPTPLTVPRVVTLQDGTVVSTNENETRASTFGDLPLKSDLPLVTEATGSKSIDEMLRDRCRVHKSPASSIGAGYRYNSNEGESHSSPELEAVMDSLCLDASMLLLSSHGMAMQLSPCQLDAIENVLQAQLGAIKEAKHIQGRVRSHTKQTKKG